MSNKLTWGKFTYSEGTTWDYPKETSCGKSVFLRKINGKWHMDAGFDAYAWKFEPMEGVKNIKEAKAVAMMVWRMS